jgi:hypothetical protein
VAVFRSSFSPAGADFAAEEAGAALLCAELLAFLFWPSIAVLRHSTIETVRISSFFTELSFSGMKWQKNSTPCVMGCEAIRL